MIGSALSSDATAMPGSRNTTAPRSRAVPVRSLRVTALSLAVLFAGPGPARDQSPETQSGQAAPERTILPGGPGLNRIGIDVRLLAGALPFRRIVKPAAESGAETVPLAQDGLDDLRIFDRHNRPISFLLAAPAAAGARWVEGKLLGGPATAEASGFIMDLGSPLPIDRVRIGGLPPPFQKRARLEGSPDRHEWRLLIGEGTLYDLPGAGLRRLEIGFAECQCRFVRLTWDDHASAVLPLPGSASARAAGPPPPLELPLGFTRLDSAPGSSRYGIRLPARRMPVIAIAMKASGENVLRQVRIMDGGEAGGQPGAGLLGVASLWHRAREAADATEMRIPISAPRGASLELQADDRARAPLRLIEVRAVLAGLPWIYFESPDGQPLKAIFGELHPAAPAPDPAPLRAMIDRQEAKEARWGDETAGPRAPGRLVKWTLPLWLSGMIAAGIMLALWWRAGRTTTPRSGGSRK